jgi:hypothetical protein
MPAHPTHPPTYILKGSGVTATLRAQSLTIRIIIIIIIYEVLRWWEQLETQHQHWIGKGT